MLENQLLSSMLFWRQRMNNKVLIKLKVPDLDDTYDVFIPINRKIGNVIELLNKSLGELTKGVYQCTKRQNLYNKYTGNRYNNNSLVVDTDIRNGTHVILI